MREYKICTASDKGKVRELNEDYYLTVRLGGVDVILVAVADGVGGLMAGEVASKMALTTFSAVLLQKLVDHYKGMKIFDDSESLDINDDLTIQRAVKEAIDEANQSVRRTIRNSGTTLTAALILGRLGVGYVINVGDSRAYLVSQGEIHQVTRDHSVPWRDFEEELKKMDWKDVDLEKFSEWKRKYLTSHPRAHVIMNVVGYFGEVGYFDIYRLNLYKGDRLLLATDGLTDMVNDYEILKAMMKESCNDAVKELINKANEKGGEDNITVAVLEVS